MTFSFAISIVLIIAVALPAERAVNPKCDFLAPIAKDLLDNLFENECGDAVCSFASHGFTLSQVSPRLTVPFVSSSMTLLEFPQQQGTFM
jgi:hypothetical protein